MLSFIAFMLPFFILQDDLLSFDGFSIAQFSEYYFLVPARFAHKKTCKYDDLHVSAKAGSSLAAGSDWMMQQQLVELLELMRSDL